MKSEERQIADRAMVTLARHLMDNGVPPIDVYDAMLNNAARVIVGGFGSAHAAALLRELANNVEALDVPEPPMVAVTRRGQRLSSREGAGGVKVEGAENAHRRRCSSSTTAKLAGGIPQLFNAEVT